MAVPTFKKTSSFRFEFELLYVIYVYIDYNLLIKLLSMFEFPKK